SPRPIRRAGSGRDADREGVGRVEAGAGAPRVAVEDLEVPGPARGDERARRRAEVDVLDEGAEAVRDRGGQPMERRADAEEAVAERLLRGASSEEGRAEGVRGGAARG